MVDVCPLILIVGCREKMDNYIHALSFLGLSSVYTEDLESCYFPNKELSPFHITDCDALLLPGGGDINPLLYGQKNTASNNIDTVLDLYQWQALDIFVNDKKPILGICKGIQLINLYFGGTLFQELPTHIAHEWSGSDCYHLTKIKPNSFLCDVYGRTLFVNSAHHQGIEIPGRNLQVVQTADDNVIEAVEHSLLPILGVQWHPERLLPDNISAFGGFLLIREFFLSRTTAPSSSL